MKQIYLDSNNSTVEIEGLTNAILGSVVWKATDVHRILIVDRHFPIPNNISSRKQHRIIVWQTGRAKGRLSFHFHFYFWSSSHLIRKQNKGSLQKYSTCLPAFSNYYNNILLFIFVFHFKPTFLFLQPS